MRVKVGSLVWISVERGVVEARVIEIESKAQQLLRLRDSFGDYAICSVLEVYASEREALRARCDLEDFWARKYRSLSEECAGNLGRFRGRLARLESNGAAAR